MGFDRLIRRMVAVANNLTSSLQCDVSHYAWTGSDEFSKPTYATAVTRKAIVSYDQKEHRMSGGNEIVQKASIVFVGPISSNGASDRREPIDNRDKIVLPNGYTGPIIEIIGVSDPSTGAPYALEVLMG